MWSISISCKNRNFIVNELNSTYHFAEQGGGKQGEEFMNMSEYRYSLEIILSLRFKR